MRGLCLPPEPPVDASRREWKAWLAAVRKLSVAEETCYLPALEAWIPALEKGGGAPSGGLLFQVPEVRALSAPELPTSPAAGGEGAAPSTASPDSYAAAAGDATEEAKMNTAVCCSLAIPLALRSATVCASEARTSLRPWLGRRSADSTRRSRDKTVMFDCGIHPAFKGMDSLPLLDEIDIDTVDVALITHFHLDHCAAVPYLLRKTRFKGRIFMTHPTEAIYRLMDTMAATADRCLLPQAVGECSTQRKHAERNKTIRTGQTPGCQFAWTSYNSEPPAAASAESAMLRARAAGDEAPVADAEWLYCSWGQTSGTARGSTSTRDEASAFGSCIRCFGGPAS
ncbi:hypothetical protein HYH03_015445 [Edaphochlamys debaryana]|uniref:Metallo-beta-lactamase domain-containing protein n=1 Tax=Edaphochlamys debaryana TaxID=47281 RepID=A0A836BR86_9CHLO|nr:hypothetical protein HYH03_015445 [Edaphochlamys debaryana]|eukprot:KAG2485862.1 hypothetical protein HYH03_015445 [Edaphochlamys debaryana]